MHTMWNIIMVIKETEMRLKCTTCARVNCHIKCKCPCHKLALEKSITSQIRELDLELHGA